MRHLACSLSVWLLAVVALAHLAGARAVMPTSPPLARQDAGGAVSVSSRAQRGSHRHQPLQVDTLAPLAPSHRHHRLGPRQYDGDDGSGIDCKDASFSDPKWYLYDPQYTVYNYSSGGRTGDVGFAGYNVAMDINAQCFARKVNLAPKTGEDNWHDCLTPPNTRFRFNLTANTMEIKQSWVCNNAPSITFMAGGTVELPFALGCGDTPTDDGGTESSCLLGNTEIRATLSAPVDITPYTPWPAWLPYEFPDRCVDRSGYPTWEVDGLVYDHMTTTGQQNLSFNLTNISNGVAVSCALALNESLTRSTAHNERWLDCGSNSASVAHVSGTQIMFDGDYSLLGVKQSWFCGDAMVNEDGVLEPSTYSGFAYLTSPLNCSQSTPYEGETYASGAKYTCGVPGGRVNVTGWPSDDAPTTIPRTRYAHSCTMNSLNLSSVALLSYDAAAATFVLNNTGPADEYRIGPVANVVADAAWHQCGKQGSPEIPFQLYACEYMLAAKEPGAKVGFRIKWACDDRDPYHAITFDATVAGILPAIGAAATNLTVTNLTWVSTDAPMDRGPLLPWI